MTDEEYLNSLNIPEKNRLIVTEVLSKYGKNKWWLSNNIKVLAYYQLHEDILIVEFNKFHKGIEQLLGRPVWTHEFGVCIDDLRKEAQKIWNGIQTNNEQKIKAIYTGMNALEQHFNGQVIITVR